MIKRPHIAPGSFAAVIRAYIASKEFAALAEGTRVHWARYLHIAQAPDIMGALDVNEIDSGHVFAFIDGMSDRPGAARMALGAIQALAKWATPRRLLPPVPITFGVKAPKLDGGHTPWTEEQIAYAIANCRPHIARVITLAADTGQRLSDIIRMQWSHLREVDGHGGIDVTQQKTGKEIWVPLLEQLRDALDMWQRPSAADQLAFPVLRYIALNYNGMPWATANAVSSLWTGERNLHPPLKGLVMHGLRGAACVRLCRAGINDHQIADFVGMSIPMVARYTRKSQQEKNAIAVLHHLGQGRAKPQREPHSA